LAPPPVEPQNELDELQQTVLSYTDPKIREFFLRRIEEIRRRQAREIDEFRQSISEDSPSV